MDGVQKHQARRPNILVVSFDDEKTDADVIIRALRAGNFFVQGRPVYLKAFPTETQIN